ncbi:TIGR02147 family protein [Bdellovibrio sp. HCB337]|uniref:TIGR02147 family protein n=1 Tax=Bdellovibrio sp. HCB337 TaxID=3394358 RepID=UPI0039A4D313
MTLQQFIQQQFKQRQDKNPKFSLRAFARLLQTDPSSLSKILNGKRIPSPKTISMWIEKLKLNEEEATELVKSSNVTDSFNPLSSEFFESTYSWAHPILLEAVKLPDFPRRTSHLARLFGMTEEQIEQTLDYLAQHNILRKNSDQRSYAPTNMTTMPIPYTTELRRNLQKKYLDLAQKAVEEVPFEQRDNRTLTIAIHSEDLPAIRAIIHEAQNKINKISEKRRSKVNTVYNFSSAFYPVIEESLP